MTVEKILLTHGHIDHVGGAAELKEALGVEIEGPHLADRFLMDGVEAQARSYGLTGVRNATTDRWLDEGDEVTVAGHASTILHCPGHSPGSVVFVYEPQRLALGGRRAVSRVYRSHGLSLWRPRCADFGHQDEGVSAGRRLRLHLRPRPDRARSARSARPTRSSSSAVSPPAARGPSGRTCPSRRPA